MPSVQLPTRQRHYYEVLLTAPGDVVYTGKGPSEAAARTKARSLAKSRGGFSTAQANALPEEVRSLVGPNPQTFTGNGRTPDDRP